MVDMSRQNSRLRKRFVLLVSVIVCGVSIALSATQLVAANNAMPKFAPNSIVAAQTTEHPALTATATATVSEVIQVTTTSTPVISGFKPGDPTATPLGSDITDPNFVEGKSMLTKQKTTKK